MLAVSLKVQLLFFPGCPHVDAARQALASALAQAGLPTGFQELDTTSAECPQELRGWGSPTILIDGRDVAGQVPAHGSACRLYADCAEGSPGVPSEQAIAGALERALPPTAG